MKSPNIILICVLATLAWLPGCGTVKRVGKATTDLVTGGSDPAPESQWNSERTWRKVGENPPTYAPHNFTGRLGQGGEWMTDDRDGKRFFVPAGGVDGIPESVLRAEAWKAIKH